MPLRLPVANELAALTVFPMSDARTPAVAVPGERRRGKRTDAIPRRDRRVRSNRRPRSRRRSRVDREQPINRAASSRVLASR